MARYVNALKGVRERTGAGFIRFTIIGGGGFLIDTALTMLFLDALGAFFARSIGFSVAVAFTYLVNRQFSFGRAKVRRARTEAILYFTIQAAGAALNFLVFLMLIAIGPNGRLWVLGYLTISAGVGLVWNYALNRIFVYERRTTGKVGP